MSLVLELHSTYCDLAAQLYQACKIIVKKIAFGNKEHTKDWKMGVSVY